MSAIEWPMQVDIAGVPELSTAVIDEQADLARSLAAEYHSGQMYDEACDITYFDGHLTPVVAIGEMLCRLSNRHRLAIPALWLHDTFEDTTATYREVADRGVIAPVIDIASLLTRRQGEGRKQYIETIAQVDDAALAKMSDSLGNMRVNLEFHDHEPLSKVQLRLLRYPRNVARLAPVVFGERVDLEESEMQGLVAQGHDQVFRALVGELIQMRDVLTFDGSLSDEQVRHKLLTHPRRIAFLAPLVLGQSVRPDLLGKIRAAVQSTSEVV
jgi:hypothetical protein